MAEKNMPKWNESHFGLYYPPSRHNGRVIYAVEDTDFPTVPTIKHPVKLHVWGMVNSQVVPECMRWLKD